MRRPQHHHVTAIRVLDRQVVSRGVDASHVHRPTLVRIGEDFLLQGEIDQIVVIERVGLAHVAAGLKLVKPDLACGRALLEEQHHGFDAGALESAAGHVQHRMQIAALQQQLADAGGCVVGVAEERVLDDDGRAGHPPSAS